MPLLILLALLQHSGPEPIDLGLARQYFGEAKKLAEADGGRLWGQSVAGPMIFVELKSRFCVANRPDAEGRLQEKDGLFVGTLPPKVPVANFAVKWAGVHWSMVVWNFIPAKNAAERGVLLMHESWHRIQDDLKLPASSPANAHLDTLQGRYWLQMEWKALLQALQTHGKEQNTAIHDALVFRAHRRSLEPRAAAEENGLELNEGLANYSGMKLSGMPEQEQQLWAIKKLEESPGTLPTFVRSFAYVSGPAYGLLLDQHDPAWRSTIRADGDLGMLLATALKIPLDMDLTEADVQARAALFGGPAVLAAEQKRESARQEKLAHYRKLLFEGPVLELPMVKAQTNFNPSELLPLPGKGTIYPTLTLIAEWGKLEVRAGAFIANDFKSARVSAPQDVGESLLKGVGWELKLESSWKAVPGERQGDWKLKKN